MTQNLLFPTETLQEGLTLMVVTIPLILRKIMKGPMLRPKMEKLDIAQMHVMEELKIEAKR